jgi:Xaa-Pro aminopeptidase
MDFNAALDAVESVTTGVHVADAEPPYADFPLAEFELRYARVVRLMELHGLDVLVLTSEESIRYLTGYVSFIWTGAGWWLPGALVVTHDPAAARLVVTNHDTGCTSGSAWAAIESYEAPTELPTKVVAQVREAAGGSARVALETGMGSANRTPLALAQQLLTELSPVADASEMLSVVRMLKSSLEVERLRRAAQASAEGYRAGFAKARAGMTEEQLLCAMAAAMYEHGVTPSAKPVFLNAVAGLDRMEFSNAPGSDRPLRNGDTVFVDGAGPTRGYMADIMRMGAVGEIDPRAETWHEAAMAANAAMRTSAHAGTTVRELYNAAYDVYDAAGLAPFAAGLAGHGIGLDIWERPLLGRHEDDPNENVRLRPGMVLCVEPGMRPEENGTPQGIFMVEDMVAVTDEGPDVLSDGLERDLWRIPA